MENRFYVYLHRRKDNGVVFYVGKGTGNRASVKQGKHTAWRRHARFGYSIEYALTDATEAEAFELEEKLISEYGREMDGGTLVNFQKFSGSNRSKNPDHTREIKSFQGKQMWKNPFFRLRQIENIIKINADPEMRERKRQAMLGQKRSEETKAKHRAAKLGSGNPNYNPTEYKFVHESGEVFVGTINAMARHAGLTTSNGVGQVARGGRRQINGWFLNEVRECLPNPAKDFTEYSFIHDSGIQEKCSKSDFAKKYGLNSGSVFQLVSGRLKSAKGWKLAQ
jgi:hypothetical protein